MNIKTTLIFLIILIFFSCSQRTSKNNSTKENVGNLQFEFKSGLKIENRTNRGTSYIDSLGKNNNIRNIPITISNDTAVSIKVQIIFSKEYNYPEPHNNEKFKLIPLSKEWALDGIGVTESMINELPSYIEKPQLNKVIEPGEKLVLSIGSVYPNPAKVTGVLPRTLFVQGDLKNFPDCDWLMEKNRSSNKRIPLGLKTIFGKKCLIIPCGTISYLDN